MELKFAAMVIEARSSGILQLIHYKQCGNFMYRGLYSHFSSKCNQIGVLVNGTPFQHCTSVINLLEKCHFPADAKIGKLDNNLYKRQMRW